HLPSRSRPARLAAPHTDWRVAAPAGPGGSRPGWRHTARLLPCPPPAHCSYRSDDRLPARTHSRSSETRCSTPSPDSVWPVLQFSGVSWRRLVIPEYLPEVLPEKRYARLRLPSSGSLGHRFPTFPTRSPRFPVIG